MKTPDEIIKLHSVVAQGLINTMGKSAYNEKLKEAKDYLLKAKKECRLDWTYKEMASERIDFVDKNYPDYPKPLKSIDNALFMVAGIELDD